MASKPPARLSKCLATLRDQVNKFAPKRSKASDGWLGDAKHSMRKSDHNPEPDGTVDALDITHDPAGGVDIQKLCDAIIASRDPRVSYLICNGKIISGNGGPKPWAKRAYNGANKHNKHLHVSVLDATQDDTTPWDIVSAFKPAGSAKGDTNIKPEVKKAARDLYDGSFHAEVEAVQHRLNELGYPEFGGIDGKWGTKTRTAVLAFRADNDLSLKPLIDDELLSALMVAKPRYVNPARANATVADLRKEGAPEIKAADTSKLVGGASVAAGAVVAGGDVLDKAEGYSSLVQRVLTVIDPVKDFLQDNALLLLVGVGGVVIWQAIKIQKIRVNKHQNGEDVSL